MQTLPQVEELTTDHSDLLRRLDLSINKTLEHARSQEYWTVLTSPSTPRHLMAALLRRIFLESACFTPRVIAAAIATVGRMPMQDPRLIQRMLIHLADEADHGDIAFKNYVALGGDKEYFSKNLLTPSSFSIVSWWWGVFHLASPFAYLGGMYVFEAITAAATSEIADGLKVQGYSEQQIDFITMHATEDIKHQKLLRTLITESCAKYSEAERAIEYGLKSFLYVYPLPIWDQIWNDVQRET